MSRSKHTKTIRIEKVKELANSLLSNDRINDEERKGVAWMLERILFETDNYEGYDFREWREGGFTRWVADGMPENKELYLGNQTMRIYF